MSKITTRVHGEMGYKEADDCLVYCREIYAVGASRYIYIYVYNIYTYISRMNLPRGNRSFKIKQKIKVGKNILVFNNY